MKPVTDLLSLKSGQKIFIKSRHSEQWVMEIESIREINKSGTSVVISYKKLYSSFLKENDGLDPPTQTLTIRTKVENNVASLIETDEEYLAVLLGLSLN